MTGNWLVTSKRTFSSVDLDMLGCHPKSSIFWDFLCFAAWPKSQAMIPEKCLWAMSVRQGNSAPFSEIVAHSLSSHGSFNKQKGCLWKSQRRRPKPFACWCWSSVTRSPFMTTNGGFPSVFTKWVPVLLQHPGCKGSFGWRMVGSLFWYKRQATGRCSSWSQAPTKIHFQNHDPQDIKAMRKLEIHRDPIMALSWDTITFWDRGTSGLWFWPFAWSRLGRKLKTLVEYLKWVFDEAWSIGAEWVLYITI